MSVRILIGDCVERMGELAEGSVDSVVCDPPYHLVTMTKRWAKCGGATRKPPAKDHRYRRLSKGFMGQEWDGGDVAFRAETWAEVMRVLKPGGHLIAFSGTRTYHRMVVAIEDAGFEIRDQLAWIYGSGFPKSHNQPGGWGTALKPAWEPICLARKPLIGSVAANMEAHGTGAINIDGCRIGTEGARNNGRQAGTKGIYGHIGATEPVDYGKGRWPANICHDGSDEVVSSFPDAPGQLAPVSTNAEERKTQNVYGVMKRGNGREGEASADRRYTENGATNFAPLPGARRDDSGSAARFFYSAKATTAERGEGNNHPTVKPIDLMRWLVRLVTPVGGTVLDPFMGSGTTGIACQREGFAFIGCELSPDYAAIAERRMRDDAGMFAEIEVAA